VTDRAGALPILVADDNTEDCEFLRDAFAESPLSNPLCFVKDGVELTDFLYGRGKYTPRAAAPRPGLILRDLNMPLKDGREALAEIKADPALRQIPTIALTTSRAEEDVYRSYDLGVSSHITKPVTFKALVHVVTALGLYWLEIVKLPGGQV
jgi:CheY-like chemotaxis protein